jgi:hypothetical protein
MPEGVRCCAWLASRLIALGWDIGCRKARGNHRDVIELGMVPAAAKSNHPGMVRGVGHFR